MHQARIYKYRGGHNLNYTKETGGEPYTQIYTYTIYSTVVVTMASNHPKMPQAGSVGPTPASATLPLCWNCPPPSPMVASPRSRRRSWNQPLFLYNRPKQKLEPQLVFASTNKRVGTTAGFCYNCIAFSLQPALWKATTDAVKSFNQRGHMLEPAIFTARS